MVVTKKFVAAWAILTLVLFAGCDSNNDNADPDPDPPGPEWNYGNKGPDTWMNLAPEWAICGSGTRQSPIDISVAEGEDLASWLFDYTQTDLRTQYDGKTIHLFVDAGSSITLNQKKHTLKSIHFHTTSEHTVNEVSFAGEIHFAHESADGGIAYVAVLVDVGTDNKVLAGILSLLPEKEGDPIDVPASSYNPAGFLPDIRTYYGYEGSLTTPACTEGVTWIVLQNPLVMSNTQIERLRSIMGLNFRPVQPLNDREISQGASE